MFAPLPQFRSVVPYTPNQSYQKPQGALSLYAPVVGLQPGQAYQLRLAPAPGVPLALGVPGWLDIRLTDWRGVPPGQLQILHEKPAHVFIVNQDLSEFQHVHPDVLQPGLLRVPVQFNSPGQHKLFLQFKTPEHGEQTLSQAFQLGTATSNVPVQPMKPLIPDAYWPKQVGAYTFQVTGLPTRQNPMSMFQVAVTQNGRPVSQIQPYLGAGAHGVMISQDGQAFVHTHPTSAAVNGFYQSPLMFHARIDRPGLYKMWVQTRIDDQIHTVDWVFQV